MVKPSPVRTSRAGWLLGAGFVLLVIFLIVSFLPFKISDSRDASVLLDQIWTLTWSNLKRRNESKCHLIINPAVKRKIVNTLLSLEANRARI